MELGFWVQIPVLPLTKESVFLDTEQGIDSAFPPPICPEGALSK